MSWNELRITTTATYANEISEQLFALGAVAVTFEDAGDHPIFEPAPETPRLWQQTIVVGLFEIDTPLPAFQTKEFANKEKFCHISVKHIPDEDWERRCLDSFEPIRFGKRLWICPSWHLPPEPGAINVILDPGLAFGTGSHPTTQLCLEWLDENITSHDVVLDYGCGSGILAIAALKLGAKKAIAIDNDPQAIEATHENAMRNQIDPHRLIAQLPNTTPIQAVDVLIANILAQPLIQLAPLFASLTRTGSRLILSGILEHQANAVIKAYNPLFIMEKPVFKAEWTRLEGVRR
jgi:ribosomal protein L11 methyltransferase